MCDSKCGIEGVSASLSVCTSLTSHSPLWNPFRHILPSFCIALIVLCLGREARRYGYWSDVRNGLSLFPSQWLFARMCKRGMKRRKGAQRDKCFAPASPLSFSGFLNVGAKSSHAKCAEAGDREMRESGLLSKYFPLGLLIVLGSKGEKRGRKSFPSHKRTSPELSASRFLCLSPFFSPVRLSVFMTALSSS